MFVQLTMVSWAEQCWKHCKPHWAERGHLAVPGSHQYCVLKNTLASMDVVSMSGGTKTCSFASFCLQQLATLMAYRRKGRGVFGPPKGWFSLLGKGAYPFTQILQRSLAPP